MSLWLRLTSFLTFFITSVSLSACVSDSDKCGDNMKLEKGDFLMVDELCIPDEISTDTVNSQDSDTSSSSDLGRDAGPDASSGPDTSIEIRCTDLDDCEDGKYCDLTLSPAVCVANPTGEGTPCETDDNCDSDSCKVDGEKILIECYLGARWGFYKFPLNPAKDMPVIGKDLLWRDVVIEAHQLGTENMDYLEGDKGKEALGFDLTMPLKEQLESAKKYLIAMQRWMGKEKGLIRKTVSSECEELTRCLRFLGQATRAEN